MKAISAAVAALSVVSILACDPVVQPEAPTPHFAVGGRVVGFVTGHVSFAALFPTFTVSAEKFADGTVIGRWERVRHFSHSSAVADRVPAAPLQSQGSDGVFMAGPVTEGSLNPQIKEVGFRVLDNGQGANSPPDQISGLLFLQMGEAATYCAQGKGITPALGNVTAGNILVRP